MSNRKKSKRGRKCKYPTRVQPRLQEIEEWCREGLIEVEICKRLGVSIGQFQEYKKISAIIAVSLQNMLDNFSPLIKREFILMIP